MKRVFQLPPGVVAYKLLKKGVRFLDHPISWLELHNAGIKVNQKTSYADRDILRELKTCLKHGKDLVVYDIGAHTGHYAAAIASAEAVRKVVSFEPIPDSFQQLVDRTKASGKVQTLNIALGNEPGRAEFFRNESSASSSLLQMSGRHVEHFPHTAKTTRINIEVQTLDSVVEERGLDAPDVIKVDVQGFEDRVIAGGRETFKAAKWCLVELSLVELYEGAGSFDEVYRLLVDLGFRIREVTNQLSGKNDSPLQLNALFVRE